MTDRIMMIEASVSADEALQQLHLLSREGDLQLRRTIFYPYHAFRASCSVPTLIGRQRRQLHCLVDAVNGHGATADRFETSSRASAGLRQLLPAIDVKPAKDIARRTVTHHLGKVLRTIAAFDVTLAAEGMVWKQFYVIGNAQFSMLVDSTSLAMHPLRQEAQQCA